MKKIFIVCATASMLLTTSCATIFTGTKDTISFKTNPEGAKVYIDGLEICKTPCTQDVKRSIGDKLVEFKLDGYETKVIKLDKEFNPISIINLGFLIGWGVDAATGAIMKYDKKGYEIDLDKKVSLNNSNKVNINTKDKVVEVYIAEK